MLIHRSGDIESCPSGHVSCPSSNIAVSGSDAAPLSPSSDPDTTTYTSKPGVRRFIGIGMVAAIVLIALALWLYFAKYPRRKLARLGRRDKATQPAPEALSASPDEDAEAQRAAETEKDGKEREKARNLMLQAEPRGVIKEVSGGVVMYTEVPRPPPLLPRRDRQPTAEWAFEHVHGVRFEVSALPGGVSPPQLPEV